MSFKVGNSSQRQNDGGWEDKVETANQQPKEFEHDTGDNYLFKEIQVEDLSSITRPETIWISDHDMPIYQLASNLEVKRIKATCKSDPSIVIDAKGKKDFYGLGKKIAVGSQLGVLNIQRSVEGLPELGKDDFEFEEYQTLKNNDEEKSFELAKMLFYKKLKEIRLQYGISNIRPLLGEGACFRESLPTVRKYKGNRADTARPLLLKRIRQWVLDECNGIMADELHNELPIEADDKLEFFAHQGYKHYKKYGWFSYGVLSSDKDSMNSPKLLISTDRHREKDGKDKGKLKFPKAMLIEDTSKGVGDLVLIASEKSGNDVKGYGFIFLLYQAFTGLDSADNYSALGHLGGMNFGKESAYKALKPCKTPKEALQKCIDVFAELLPYGVQYTDHLGVEHDVDTFTYMDTYFHVAYMLRSPDDKMDFSVMCNAFKVDTSKIVGNNKLTPPKPTFVSNETAEQLVLGIKSSLEETSSNIKNYSALKKGELVEMIKGIKESLEATNTQFDNFYEMKQEEK